MAVPCDVDQADCMLAYLAHLHHWNQRLNLTAIRNPQAMIIRHILDSLAISRFIEGQTLLDVGSGAGLPGLPLAIAWPKKHITLLDSVGKKVSFLRHVIHTLKLSNVTALHQRLERHADDHYDTIVARAFAPLEVFLPRIAHVCQPGSLVIAMGGRLEPAIESKVMPPFQILEMTQYQVPGLAEHRHVVVLQTN